MIALLRCAAALSTLAFAAAPLSRVESELKRLSDAQVSGALTAANDGEIDAARLAETRVADPQVRGFAQHMIADHSASNSQLGSLARRLNVTPQSSPESASLTEDAKAQDKVLQTLTGAAFDRAYMERQVADHRAVLDLIDGTLLPSATSDDLRTLLRQARDVVRSHLDAAERIERQVRAP